MKKRTHKCICVVLCILLVFSLLCGCGDPAVTSTDITTNEPVITEKKNESILSAESVAKPADGESTFQENNKSIKGNSTQTVKKEKSAQPVKKGNVSTQKTESIASYANSIVAGTGEAACLKNNIPTFYSQKSLNDWLAKGTGLEKQWGDFLKTFHNPDEITYYAPCLEKLPTNFYKCRITFHELTGQCSFNVDSKDDKDIENRASSTLRVYGFYKGCPAENACTVKLADAITMYENKDPSVTKKAKNGTTYYLRRYTGRYPQIAIYWEQNGAAYTASIHGHEDQMDQILEALNMQPVTVKIEK